MPKNMEATTSIAVSQLIGLSQNLASINLGYLNIAVTILVLLGGGTYFFSVKPFKDKLDKQEDELKNTKKEIEDSFIKAKDDLDNELKDFKADNLKELNTLLKQREQKIVSDFESKLSNLDKNLFEKINVTAKEKDDSLKETILSDFSTRNLELEKKLSSSIDTYKVTNDKEIALLKNKIENGLRELNIIVRELEAFKYDQEGKQGGIIKLIDSLGDDIQYRQYAVKYKLGDIKEKLPKYELGPELYIKLKSLLNSIKGKEILGEKHDNLIMEIDKLITIKKNPGL